MRKKCDLDRTQIAVNNSAKYAFVIEGVVLVAEMICRYAVFKDLYLQSISLVTDELKRALVQLYTAILIYLSKVKSYYDQNTAGKYRFLVLKYQPIEADSTDYKKWTP